MTGWNGMRTIAVALVWVSFVAQACAQPLPADFVYLRDLDPTILQDIRYAGSNNFAGRPLRGYGAAECVVRRGVAERLQRAQRELAAQNLSLKMFDCYRPARAVADMWAWAHDGRETAADRRFNPAFAKQDLFRLGYIARYSGHSTGAALDLSLVDLAVDHSQNFDAQKSYADCTAAVDARAPEGSVDMGTGYDCTDLKANTAATAITPEQRRWRQKLVAVMQRQGFVNYFREWWHFSLPGGDHVAYDFPIEPRTR
jgi:D-alanyl-D-alanine dipeptidase